MGVTGLFYGDSKQLVAQVIEVVVCIGWNVVVGGILFAIIGKLVGNRVPAAVELAGLDVPEMGVQGYPEYLPAPDAEPVVAAKAV
jgi:Amt family ammonium transporter